MAETKKHIDSISCGQGAPSIYLIVAAGQGVFPADVVIVADTGDENDMLWSTGERSSAREFYEQVTKPLAEEFGLEAVFVRANDGDGNPLPPIHLDQKLNGKVDIDMPLFGSNGGRLRQSCTSKWKKAAIRQELRRRGADTATSNLGITLDEVHRIKPNTDVQWETLAWPLCMIEPLHKASIVDRLQKMGVPYMVSSQCDKCPHKSWWHWSMSTPETIKKAAEFEAQFSGEFFLTEYRVPLLEAIQLMDSRKPRQSLDVCGSVCFT